GPARRRQALDASATERGLAVNFDAPPPSIEKIEREIAVDLAKKAAIVTPIVVIAVGIWRGPDAALGAFLALALVVVNFFASAAILGWTAKHAPHALPGARVLRFVRPPVILSII